MSTTQNEIIVSNVTTNDKIYYQLLIIKGKVCNITHVDKLEILLNHELIEYHEYIIENSTYKFIVLTKLSKLGTNYLEFKFGNTRLELNVSRLDPICEYSVVPLYVIFRGHSGNFQSIDEYFNTPQIGCNRLQLGLELIQSIYGEKLHQEGYDKKTFRIEKSCDIFYSQLEVEDAYRLADIELWQYLAREIISAEKGDFRTKKYIAFLSFTHFTGLAGLEYNYENIFKNTKGRIAISTGGLALLGTGCLYAWADRLDEIFERLKSNRIVDVTKLLDDSNYRKTYGGCYSTTLGTLCHELGHLFDLGHTEDGIMGNEIDFINRVFNLKNLTENLPNRILASAKTVVVTPAPRANTKLTKIKKPGSFLDAYHKQKNNDLCYFTKNCVITLNYHKWFNTSGDKTSTTNIVYYANERLVASNSSAIRLIELRQPNNGMLIEFWSYLDENIYEFVFGESIELASVTIFVINDAGDIFKCDV